jgi:hypothetical protein
VVFANDSRDDGLGFSGALKGSLEALAAQPNLITAGAAPSRQALATAQARLMHDRSLQFQFAQAPPDPKVSPPPGWLKALLDFLAMVAHALGWLFWAAAIAAVVVVIGFIVLELARTRWPDLLRRTRKAKPRPAPLDWRPEASVARALLEDADRLAAEGQYAEAVHLLLYRSIEDIEGRRPRLVRPALTAREISSLDDLPAAARATFTAIAQVVERSFFGGRDVDKSGFEACRSAYEAFAFPGAWA